MAARKRQVLCDGCGRVGGSYGPTASADGLRNLRRLLAKECHWTTAGKDRCPDCQDPPVRRWSARDDFTLTTLSAATYPYGGGEPDQGVQLTLRRDRAADHGEPYQVLRLPHPRAVELARWILATYGEA